MMLKDSMGRTLKCGDYVTFASSDRRITLGKIYKINENTKRVCLSNLIDGIYELHVTSDNTWIINKPCVRIFNKDSETCVRKLNRKNKVSVISTRTVLINFNSLSKTIKNMYSKVFD